jgi:hypothetical protein
MSKWFQGTVAEVSPFHVPIFYEPVLEGVNMFYHPVKHEVTLAVFYNLVNLHFQLTSFAFFKTGGYYIRVYFTPLPCPISSYFLMTVYISPLPPV